VRRREFITLLISAVAWPFGVRAQQAGKTWRIGVLETKPRVHLAARPLLAQHQGSTPILADDVERVLADIDADHLDLAVEYLGHGRLLCLQCPLPVWITGRAGARPDHPILGHRPAAQRPGLNSYAIPLSVLV
jgi:hypothetical protein